MEQETEAALQGPGEIYHAAAADAAGIDRAADILAKAAGAGDTESREKMFCDWTCVGIGKSGDDFRIECMRRRDTSDGSKQKTLAETLDPYSSY